MNTKKEIHINDILFKISYRLKNKLDIYEGIRMRLKYIKTINDFIISRIHI